ncbi:iron-containing alcohol dehydrogenase [Pelomonas sp. KK5]|uniref:iron-containing alcohol dehydrogenase n=1 Tax=Pelomonas sp. KK5 TaxID=1855730 RepID=UPI0009FA352A|nr:iron-containing alcohol dehydrogenase [Pelomonas sp. KK5]
MMIATLTVPRTLFAAGAVSALRGELALLGVSRPLLVTDKGIVAAGLVAKLAPALGDAAALMIFDGVTENPLFADVDAGAALYAQQRCDGVIALGGGSVIDVAKLVALLGTNPGSVGDYAGVPNAAHRATAPLVVIPTTAGTGSEASPSAGLHPDATTPSVGINSPHLVPAVAILDPDFTLGLPLQLTAATGIDALSHCIEGYLSTKDQPFGELIALDGVARVARHLRRAVADGSDGEARAAMLFAACAGGISIGMGLGPAHAIALSCSDQGFHHGILSGIGLVATLDGTAAHAPGKMAALAAAFGLAPGASPGSAIAALMRELGLPATLAELGYAAPSVEALAEAAHRSHFNRFAPWQPSAAEYAGMIAASLRSDAGR